MPIAPLADDVRRGRRRVAMRRATTLVAVGGLVVAAWFAVAQLGDPQSTPHPADSTEKGRGTWCPKDISPDCFDINGWIVYGDRSRGIWAVDPTGPGDPDNQIQLSDRLSDAPLEWSSDGTKLLVRRHEIVDRTGDGGLVVLNADGTENRVVDGDGYGLDGSFSPDGSQVIYAWYGGGGIYTVDSDGGTPHLLLAHVSRPYPGEQTEYLGELYNPAFSPDGTLIAYFDGMGDWGHSLRVMRSDGTDIRVLVDDLGSGHVDDLAWSPDGQRLMIARQAGEGGFWTIGVDGSGLTQVVPKGVNPAWSPDGTRISYQPTYAGPLRIARNNGREVTEFGYGGSGPWKPA
ncbi:MAG TPA: hypothetical protein VLI04_10780 [Nocardioidaceae bacterium]|nr:hypothetical protein [Nocardioidaceae bacterium]